MLASCLIAPPYPILMATTVYQLPDYLPAALKEAARLHQLAKGERLFKQGDPVSAIFADSG